MKKILSLVAALSFSVTVFANQTSVTVINGTTTNLFTGGGFITQLILVAPTSTNATGLLYDSPTNAMSYAVGPYTNIISYLTNDATLKQYYYTNYFNVVTTLTNSTTTSPGFTAGNVPETLVDLTNVTAIYTNAYPSYSMGAAGNSVPTIVAPNLSIIRGAWFTNSGAQPFSVTAIWTPR